MYNKAVAMIHKNVYHTGNYDNGQPTNRHLPPTHIVNKSIQ
jgi:hypothetical protein